MGRAQTTPGSCKCGPLPEDLDAVVHAASPGGATDESYKTAYVDGPRNLLSALAPRNSLRRFALVSSTGVYGQKNGEWDEFARLSGIYGPGRTGAVERSLREPPRDEDQPRYTNRIHRNDCAGAPSQHYCIRQTSLGNRVGGYARMR